MSKAFTKEDDAEEYPVAVRPVSLLPPGTKNYMTSDGAVRLKSQLASLVTQRSRLAEHSDDPDTRRQLRTIEQRIQQLELSLQSAVVQEPSEDAPTHVRFGHTVTVKERTGERVIYRVVGVDETDVDRGWVSFLSPVGRALLGKAPGERVKLHLPGGDQELEILSIQ